MQKFELVLKNEKLRSYRMLLKAFIILNFVFFLALAILTQQVRERKLAIICISLIVAGFIIEYLTRKRANPYNGKSAALVFILIAYFNLEAWWAVAATFFIGILYSISIRKLIVSVNRREIMYPSFPRKKVEWTSLNNIILKDGILTIDYKSNKVAQAEVINGENDYDLDEKEFNDFCRQKLAEAKLPA